jgi:hypothetical protein
VPVNLVAGLDHEPGLFAGPQRARERYVAKSGSAPHPHRHGMDGTVEATVGLLRRSPPETGRYRRSRSAASSFCSRGSVRARAEPTVRVERTRRHAAIRTRATTSSSRSGASVRAAIRSCVSQAARARTGRWLRPRASSGFASSSAGGRVTAFRLHRCSRRADARSRPCVPINTLCAAKSSPGRAAQGISQQRGDRQPV